MKIAININGVLRDLFGKIKLVHKKYYESNIEEVKNNDKLADDMKQNIIAWEEENLNLGHNMIAKIDKKLNKTRTINTTKMFSSPFVFYINKFFYVFKYVL